MQHGILPVCQAATRACYQAHFESYLTQTIAKPSHDDLSTSEENPEGEPTALWQAAPLLVLKKDSKSRYRLETDSRPVNAATTKESLPMTHLFLEVLDFTGSVFFSILDFVSAYWQLPLHPNSYSLCSIVGPKEFVVSKIILPGHAKATSPFQSAVEPLFQELRENMKAWLDDFSLHYKNEE